MSIFKPRRKKVVEAETETALPDFSISIDGFLMFNNPRLGGCGVFEIAPRVCESAWSHFDGLQTENTIGGHGKVLADSDQTEYEDARGLVMHAWVPFLNGLLPKESNTGQTHIQILGKKTRLDENSDSEMYWDTRPGYSYITTLHGFEPIPGSSKAIRMADYVKMLEHFRDENYRLIDEKGANGNYAYEVRWYIVVSYTPSSEGWWYDGRDSDYYIVESARGGSSPAAMFSNFGLVEKVAEAINTRRERKSDAMTENTALDMFPLATDMTTAVLHTRMSDLYSLYFRIAQGIGENLLGDAASEMAAIDVTSYGVEHMPFRMRRMRGQEVASIVAFFPDILSPYRERAVKQLGANINDIYIAMDAEQAVLTHDESYVRRYEDDIIKGTLDINVTDQEVENFRRQHAQAPDDLFSSGETGNLFAQWGFKTYTEEHSLWDGLGMPLESAKVDQEREFRNRFARRRISTTYRKKAESLRKSLDEGLSKEDIDDLRRHFDNDQYWG